MAAALPLSSLASSFEEDEGISPPLPPRPAAAMELEAAEGVKGERTVRIKAAFFEALIRSNNTAFVRCEYSRSEDDSPCSSSPTLARRIELASLPSSCHSAPEDLEGGGRVALRLSAYKRRAQEVLEGQSEAAGNARAVGSLRARVAALEAQLARREAECDNLRRVVRELAASRSKAVATRAELAERYTDMQGRLARAQRVAELSRAASRKHMEITARERSALRGARVELRALRNSTARLTAQAERSISEGAALRERLSVLERLDEAAVLLVARSSLTGSPITHARWQLAETY